MSSIIPSTYTGQTYNASSNTTKATGDQSKLGKDAFMTMFLAQLQYQDPMNPMDNTQFTAQLATFSQLEQLQTIATNTEAFGTLNKTVEAGQALGMLGREITVSGNTLSVTNGAAGSMNFTVAGSSTVRALVYDSEGKLVIDKTIGHTEGGSMTFKWDAANAAGQQVEDGQYTVSIVATDAQGNSVNVSNMTTTGVVTGYTKGSDGTVYVKVGNTSVKLSNVTGVSASSGTSTGADDASTSSILSTIASLASAALL